ncbi:RNA-dependent RNA polymerase [Erysiphe necator associated ourmia-like virus 85]|nr:RNA-dependent RNA polymerase [Erysiphe necator associated ourmia-like virus 85]
MDRHQTSTVLADLRQTSPSTLSSSEEEDLRLSNLRFSSLVQYFNRCYRIDLPPLTFSSVKAIKSFCGLALESKNFSILKFKKNLNNDLHPWGEAISSLSPTKRVSIFGSVFLFRKVLPASDPPNVDEYVRKMVTPSRAPDPGFLAFIRKELDRMFPVGWDRGYDRRIDRMTLPTSACWERKRSDGGARAVLMDEHMKIERKEFCDYLRGSYKPSWMVTPNTVRAVSVFTGGKYRIVTKNRVSMQSLGALHDTLYSFLTKKSAFLRGEADPGSFEGFEAVRGELFVSGDYESATDNLSLEVQRLILTMVTDRCTHVPSDIIQHALASQSCGFFSAKGEFLGQQARGQLMGNLLSFPLLCLVNYLAFKYFVPRKDVPVRINGDDIVFRARPDEISRWREGVQSAGLTLSSGKTLVDNRFFSLNSTFFSATFSRISLVRVIRSTWWFSAVEDASSIAERMACLASASPNHVRTWLHGHFLRLHRHSVFFYQRSLRRGLGVRVSDAAIACGGYSQRESFYSKLDSEAALPTVSVGYHKQKIPERWHRVETKDSSQDEAFLSALVDAAWNPSPEDRVIDWKSGTLRFRRVGKTELRKLARLANLSLVECRRFLGLTKIKMWKETKKEKHWKLESSVLTFVSGGVLV